MILKSSQALSVNPIGNIVIVVASVSMVAAAMNPEWIAGGEAGQYQNTDSAMFNAQVDTLIGELNSGKSTPKQKHDAQYELGELYYSAGDLNQALGYWSGMAVTYSQLSSTLDSASADYLVDDGAFMTLVVRHELGDTQVAYDGVAGFRQAFPGSNRIPESYFFEAGLLAALGQPKNAITAYQSVVATYPTTEFAGPSLYEMGQLHLSGDQREDAKAAFRSVIQDYPNSLAFRPALSSLNGVLVGDAIGGCCSGNCCHGGGGGVTPVIINEVVSNLGLLLGGGSDGHLLSGGVTSARLLDFADFCHRPIDQIGIGNVGLYGNLIQGMNDADPNAPETTEVRLIYGKQLFASDRDAGIAEIRSAIDVAVATSESELEFDGRHLLIRLLGSSEYFPTVGEEIEIALASVSDDGQRGELLLEKGFHLWRLGDLDGAIEVFEALSTNLASGFERRISALNFIADLYDEMGDRDSADVTRQKISQMSAPTWNNLGNNTIAP